MKEEGGEKEGSFIKRKFNSVTATAVHLCVW